MEGRAIAKLAPPNDTTSLALIVGVSFVSPICFKRILKQQHTNLRESQLMQRQIRGPDIWAMLHGAAPAINHQAGRTRQLRGPRIQLLQSIFASSAAMKLRT